MKSLRILALVIGSLCMPYVLGPFALAQQSVFDQQMPTTQGVRASLKTLARLELKDALSANEILQIYLAEKAIGHCVWGPSPRDSAKEWYDPTLNRQGFYADTTLEKRCVRYVQEHRVRFRVVDDMWKGERNFMEPTGFWPHLAMKLFPDSSQSHEISFDLEFNELVRRYDISESAKGKTCKEYYDGLLKENRDIYLEVYSPDEIARWPAECKKVRETFIKERSGLLDRYHNAPFTKRLRDIDPTTVVVFHSIC